MARLSATRRSATSASPTAPASRSCAAGARSTWLVLHGRQAPRELRRLVALRGAASIPFSTRHSASRTPSSRSAQGLPERGAHRFHGDDRKGPQRSRARDAFAAMKSKGRGLRRADRRLARRAHDAAAAGAECRQSSVLKSLVERSPMLKRIEESGRRTVLRTLSPA